MDKNMLKHTKKHFSQLGLMFFLGSLVIFAVQTAVSLIVPRVAPILVSDMNLSLFTSMLPVYAIAIPIMALLINQVPAAVIPRRRMTFVQFLMAFCMSYAIMYIGNVAGQITTFGIGLVKGSPVSNVLNDVITDISPLTAFIIMVLLAPVIEEFIFRKLLIDRLVNYGEGTAILFSGLMFGLFHGNLNQFAYAFLLGIFFGFIYAKTGRLIYSILLHMIINFMGSVITLLLMNLPIFQGDLADPDFLMQTLSHNFGSVCIYLFYVLAIFALVIVGTAMLILNRKEFRCCPGNVILPKGQRFSTTILNVGMLLYILLWLIQILLQLFL